MENKKRLNYVNYQLQKMEKEEVLKVCDKANIHFKNQNIGGLVADIMEKYFENKKENREIISNETKEEVKKEQNYKCKGCCVELLDTSCELDHITPLVSGGSNHILNLQYLCKNCHRLKTENEYCEYIRRNEFSSCLNMEAMRIMNSKFSLKVAFTHKIQEVDERQSLNSVDINKCRTNIARFSKYNFCRYSVLDKWEKFKGVILDGFYYVETDNYGVFHKNGVYSRPIVEYGLEKRIITKDNIKK